MSTRIRGSVRRYAPGRDITGEATAAVSVSTFVAVADNRTSGGNIAVKPATAGGHIFGVASDDAAIGQLVNIARDGVCRVVAGAQLTAGAAVQVGADGKAVPAVAASIDGDPPALVPGGVVVGLAVTGAVKDAIAEIALF